MNILKKKKKQTVIEHVLERLKSLDIYDIFGVPGDYAFPVSDAIEEDTEINWIGSCNELNAAYAADGYARIKGFSAISTTFGVGELSAINGIAGSYAEHLPVFHIVGMPNTNMIKSRSICHHTLGDGNLGLYYDIYKNVVAASAVLTPENVVEEMNRLINVMINERRPVYACVSCDLATKEITDSTPIKLQPKESNKENLKQVVAEIIKLYDKAKSGVVLPGLLLQRTKLINNASQLIKQTGIPFATMFADKGIIDESSEQFIGLYDGAVLNPKVQSYIENSDLILVLGAYISDFNTGGFTAKMDPSTTVIVDLNEVTIGGRKFHDVLMKDIITELSNKMSKKEFLNVPHDEAQGLGKPIGKEEDKISAESYYPILASFLKQNDIIVTETGTSSMGLGTLRIPSGAFWENQSLWGAIGWATPASFGAAIAAPERRTVLITGDGSHQLTAQEISQFGCHKLKPIIICLNNSAYVIENEIAVRNDMKYNNSLPPWDYTLLPRAFGITDWYTVKVSTNGELQSALKKAENCDSGAYIEVIMDKKEVPIIAHKEPAPWKGEKKTYIYDDNDS